MIMMKKFFRILLVLIVFAGLFAVRIAYERKVVYDPFELSLNSIEGFSDKMVYEEGEDLRFKIHSEIDFNAQLFRLEDSLKNIGEPSSYRSLKQSNVYSPQFGFDWEVNCNINEDLKSGYYYLRASNNKDTCFIPFVVKSSSPKGIVVVASTNTWQAYNNYGGKSFYENSRESKLLRMLYDFYPKSKPIDYLPFNRPVSFAKEELQDRQNGVEDMPELSNLLDFEGVYLGSHLIKGEWNLIHFLEENKYDYSVIGDYEFERAEGLDSIHTIIFNTHSEYWSPEMIARLRSFIVEGKNIIFASGNNVYRSIEYYRGGLLVNKNPEFQAEDIRSIIGSFYTEETYLKVAPFKSLMPYHWVMKGVEPIFGEYGASGYETDKWGVNSEGFLNLAIGQNQTGPAYMLIKEYEKGNYLFNASSIMFSKGLTRDSSIQRIMHNLLSR